jgi:hypothetical protein
MPKMPKKKFRVSGFKFHAFFLTITLTLALSILSVFICVYLRSSVSHNYSAFRIRHSVLPKDSPHARAGQPVDQPQTKSAEDDQD